jgi:hypothetical protein
VASAIDGTMNTDDLNKFFNKKHNRNVTEKDLDDYLNTYLNDKFIQGVWKDKGVNITGFRNGMKKLKSKLFSKNPK